MADLIVNDVTPRAQYVASAGQTVFSYPFEIFEDEDILAYLTPVGQAGDDTADILILTTDYTVSNAGVTGGGDMTLIVAATAGDIITILRDVATKRLTDYQTAGDLLAETLNTDLDKLVMMLQQVEPSFLRSMRLSNTDTAGDEGLVLPFSSDRANKYLVFDSGGVPTISSGTGTDNTLRDELASTLITKGSSLVSNTVQIINTLAVLKTLTGTTLRDVFVRGRAANNDGYEGAFIWDPTDLSTEVGIDTLNGIYVPPDSDSSGASGAWVRAGYTGILAQWFGTVGDGVSDDGAGWRAAALMLPTNGGTLRGKPGDIYLMEGAVNDPYTAGVNSIAVLFQNKSNIVIILDGCTIKQTSATSSTTGVFVFDTCTNCKVFGGKLSGYWDGASASAGALVAGIGLCDGITVESDVVDGGRALAVFRSSDGTASGAKPINTLVKGNLADCEYGVNYTHCGYGHHLDINIKNHLRCCYITGTPGVTGTINSFSGGGADLNISTRGGGDIYDVDLVYNGNAPNQAIEFKVEDSTAANITNIKITGSIRDCVNDSVQIKTLGHVNTVIDNIDLSDLKVINSTDSGIEILPDIAATISNIKIGDFQSKTEAVKITNNVGATIKGINMDGKNLEHNVSPAISSNVVDVSGSSGTVDDISMLGTIVDSTTTAGIDVSITVGDGVVIDGSASKAGKEIYLVGSINVRPGVNNHLNRGFQREGALAASGDTMSHCNSMRLTSGSATVTSMQRVTPGQAIIFMFDGGTQTFADGANMLLAGNLVGTAGDTITLICDDPIGGGPLATSTMREVSRSVN